MLTLFLLGTDSLIVGTAIGPLVRPGYRLRLAALFGIADGLGFLIGWSFHLQLPDLAVGMGRSLILAGYAIYVLIVARSVDRTRLESWPLWVLPVAMSFDNFSAGLTAVDGFRDVGRQVGEQILSSGGLALLGLVVGATLAARLPARVRLGLSGGAMILAAAVLVAS